MEFSGSEELDVIVVVAGNAATCAALSARENGARVLMLEIAPEELAAAIRPSPVARSASSIAGVRISRV
jgi:succinate dehydrogenase/fumarate reductase flavoprotein subunit